MTMMMMAFSNDDCDETRREMEFDIDRDGDG